MVKYNTDWFIKRIKEKHPNDYQDYEVIGKYINSHTNIKMKHLTCGHVFDITPNSLLSGRGCYYCGRKRIGNSSRNTQEELCKELPEGISLIGEFKGVLYDTLVHCDKCNSTYKVKIHDLLRRGYCAHCGNHYRKTTNTFKDDMYQMVGNEYILLSEFNTVNDKVKIKHNLCNHSYYVTPHNFLRGRRCPYCNNSIGESIIEKVLKDLNIVHERQKKFKDLKLTKYLSYDFYLPELDILIEYQGEQHYKPVEYFGGELKFKNQIIRDKAKKDYAVRSKINLLCIPYKINSYFSIRKEIEDYIKQISGNRG